MRRLSLLLLALASLLGTRCASYGVKSNVNEAHFYRQRYIERCVTAPVVGVPCEAWRAAQTKLGVAEVEAVEAIKVGGSAKLQKAALQKQLIAVRREFGSWAQ